MQEESTFAARLAIAMKMAGLNQPQLGRLVGVTKATIGQAVNGQTKELSAANCMKVARACRVDPYWLVLGDGVPRYPLGPGQYPAKQEPTKRGKTPPN